MPDDTASAARLEHVEAVEAARVVMVHPGGEDAARAQLAAVLVRVDVIRIVGTGAVILEIAEGAAIGEAAERRPVVAVRQPGRPLQQAIDVVAAHAAATS